MRTDRSLHRSRFALTLMASASLVVAAAACAPSVSSDGSSDTTRPRGPSTVRVDSAVALPVTLSGTVLPLPSRDFMATLDVEPGAAGGEVDLVWHLRSGPCMLASATATRLGTELRVTVARSGDPVALCVAGEVVYRYVMRVSAVPAGRYQVLVVEKPLGQPELPIVGGEVVVAAQAAGAS